MNMIITCLHKQLGRKSTPCVHMWATLHEECFDEVKLSILSLLFADFKFSHVYSQMGFTVIQISGA